MLSPSLRWKSEGGRWHVQGAQCYTLQSSTLSSYMTVLAVPINSSYFIYAYYGWGCSFYQGQTNCWWNISFSIKVQLFNMHDDIYTFSSVNISVFTFKCAAIMSAPVTCLNHERDVQRDSCKETNLMMSCALADVAIHLAGVKNMTV